ncbi:MAG: DUF4058 family protein, partial [Planctomycetaceae bacterium]
PGKGREQYLLKRANVLWSGVHLVELDLLRGGLRLAAEPPLRSDGHYGLVSRIDGPAPLEAYWWGLREKMASVPVPLEAGDDDAVLPLQALFNTVYDRAGYDYSLDYEAALRPPLNEADTTWVLETLAAARAQNP